MTDKKNEKNIVKKVFERSAPKSDKISALFTHLKEPKKAAVKPQAAASKSPMKRLPAAIDFGLSRIKLLQLAQEPGGSLELVLVDEELFSEDPSMTSAAKNKQALSKLLGRNAIGAQVVMGLPAKETQTFNFTFPAMSDEELRQAVRMKIRQLRPFNLDEEKIKYAILRWDAAASAAAKASAQQRVTVVCVSGADLQEKTALLNEAGLKPLSVQVCPLSLMHAKKFGDIPRSQDEVVLWLDLGAEESVLIVEKGGSVYFLRNLPVTGKTLTKQVAQGCRVTDDRAEELKRRHGLEYWTPDGQNLAMTDEERAKNGSASVALALVSMLENLVLDIEHSFKFFSYQVTQSQITRFNRIILTGGSSDLKKIDQFLSDRLAVPVHRLDPFHGIRIQEALKNQRPELLADGNRFSSALGLALSYLSEPLVLSNFFGAERKPKKPNPLVEKIKSEPRFIALSVLAVTLLAAVPQISYWMYYRQKADAAAKEVKDAKNELKRRQSSQLELASREKELLEKKALLEDKLDVFQGSRRQNDEFSQLLVKLSSLLPDEIWVTKLAYSEKKLVLVGSTSKNDKLMTFLENLKKPDAFSDVVFNYAKRDGNSSVFSFEVAMSVR